MSFSQTFSYRINNAEREESLRFKDDTSSSHGERRYFPYIFIIDAKGCDKWII